MDKDTELRLKLFDDLPAMIWHSGKNADRDYFNTTWLAFTGRTLEKESGNGWMERVHPDDLDWSEQAYREAFKDKKPFDVEYRLQRNDGKYRWIKDRGRPYFDSDKKFSGFLGLCYDVTDSREHAKQVEYMTIHDPLTGISNQLAFKGALERASARAARGRVSSMMFIDIDYFKKVNDKFGHDEGDTVLREITEALQLWLRKEDMLARMGGDEFAVLLEGQGIAEATTAAERMKHAIDGYTKTGWDFKLSLSVGITLIDGRISSDAILSKGDAAMHEAKETGRDKIVVAEGDE